MKPWWRPSAMLLVVPAMAAARVGGAAWAEHVRGGAFGVVVSVAGMLASAGLDLPTGATIICAFGAAPLVLSLALRARRIP